MVSPLFLLKDACEGYKIPPQRQIDVRMHKKIVVCEHSGKILVDANTLFD